MRRIETDLATVAIRARYQVLVKVLMAFRRIGLVTALTLVFELGDIRRLPHPRQLMAYLGLVPSEHSSGNRTKRGRGITKTGNVHVRSVVISAAWKYARPARTSRVLKERQQTVSAEVTAVTWIATLTVQTYSQIASDQTAMSRQHRGRARIDRLFVGGTAPRKPVDYHAHGLSHGL